MTKQPTPETNLAFIDAQNLYVNTKENSWAVDFYRFRVYLRDKYKVAKAYYFIGAYDGKRQSLYDAIQEAGYILVFREHSLGQITSKKGNVDTDIVFYMLTKTLDGEKFDKIILVSGDGDYWRTVNYLIEKGKFLKLLAPNRRTTSSLYKNYMSDTYLGYLDDAGVKKKIALKPKKK